MNEENSLWMGDISPDIDESKIKLSFQYFNIFPISIKFIKDKRTNTNKNYCFVFFKNNEDANNALNQLNGKVIPNTNMTFKLNRATYHSPINRTIYVGNLNKSINDDLLLNFFQSRYNSVTKATVIKDKGISKGYGFVVFKKENEYKNSLKEMNQALFLGKKIVVKEQKRKDEDDNNNNNNIYNNNIIINNDYHINDNNFVNNNASKDILLNYILRNNNNGVANDLSLLNNINIINNNKIVNNDNANNINNINNIINNKLVNNNIINNLNFESKTKNSFYNKKDLNTNFLNNNTNNINNNNNNMNYPNIFNKGNNNNIDITKLLLINENRINKYGLHKINKNNDIINIYNSFSKLNNINNNVNTKINKKINSNNNINNNGNSRNEIKKNVNPQILTKLDVLEKYDEKTLNKKIRESINKTYNHYKKTCFSNGNNIQSKLLFILFYFYMYSI